MYRRWPVFACLCMTRLQSVAPGLCGMHEIPLSNRCGRLLLAKRAVVGVAVAGVGCMRCGIDWLGENLGNMER